MKTNYHTHTARCQHATGTDEEYVLSAIKGGFHELGFSDHTPWKYRTDYVSGIRMKFVKLPSYINSLRRLREKYKEQISIKIGLECEYFPEYIPWLRTIIKAYQLDFIIFGNHHFETDEKYPYFGHHTNTVYMLNLYEKSAIEGLETGMFAYMAHPELFMRSYPEFDQHCEEVSRNICRTAARLNIPLEYNISSTTYKEGVGPISFPHPQFWKIAASEGCTAIIGLDAHDNKDLETPVHYDRACRELKELQIKVTDTIRFNTDQSVRH